jgi:hypothetical protein
MLSNNALDDDPMILDDPLYLATTTNYCEDNYDTLVVYDDTLIYESPILCLKSLSLS